MAIHAGVQAVTPGQLPTSSSLPGPEQLTRRKAAILTGILHPSQSTFRRSGVYPGPGLAFGGCLPNGTPLTLQLCLVGLEQSLGRENQG